MCEDNDLLKKLIQHKRKRSRSYENKTENTLHVVEKFEYKAASDVLPKNRIFRSYILIYETYRMPARFQSVAEKLKLNGKT